MIIDIDIRIANNEGKLLHHLSKRFDEEIEFAAHTDKEAESLKDFQDFLAEYLSVSGRAIRVKLIDNLNISTYNQYSRKTFDDVEDDEMEFREDTLNDMTNSAMEYKIRIGDNKVFIGRIPFYRQKKLNLAKSNQKDVYQKELDNKDINNKQISNKEIRNKEISNKEFNKKELNQNKKATSYESKHIKQSDYTDLCTHNKSVSGLKESAVVGKLLKNMMIQAVEKYESNFYHMNEEQDNMAEG